MDKYCKPLEYVIRENNSHFNDSLNHNDRWQKEVYVYAEKVMRENSFKKVIDVGCGSGYKLIKYLGGYDTVGYETEPCINFLRKTYPNRKWVNSGEPSESFSDDDDKSCDLVMSSDVIEHIKDPDELIKFMKSFSCDLFLISTPCLQVLVDTRNRNILGPPGNEAHVREWTFEEFKMYLRKHFDILDSKLGVTQLECQWHLCIRKKN